MHSWGQNSPNILFPATTEPPEMQGEIIAAFWGLLQFPISFGLFLKLGCPYGATAAAAVPRIPAGILITLHNIFSFVGDQKVQQGLADTLGKNPVLG